MPGRGSIARKPLMPWRSDDYLHVGAQHAAPLPEKVKLPACPYLPFDLGRSFLIARNHAEHQPDLNKPFLTCTFDRSKDSARSLDFCNFFAGLGLFYL
jgi:hypothetical protein